jgi:hypothetical protein
LQSFAPADNETNFSPISSFLMIFNQAVDVETGNITIKKTSDDSTVETISVSGGLVTGTGTNTITIDPSTNLSDLTEYYILVDATAFDDAAGNSYAGISSTTAWSFTTGDITAPTITNISSDKTNGSYKAGDVIDIDVTFSEAVTSTGNVTVTLETGDTDRTCIFTVSNSTTGTCNYTVQAGDTTGDLTVNTISGTIADQSGRAMVNFVPTTNLAANKALVIDTTVSTVGGSVPVALLQLMSDNLRKAEELKKIQSIAVKEKETDNSKLEVQNKISYNNFSKFIKDLKYGMDNEEDVRELQKFLNSNGFIVSKNGPGSIGNETNYFGFATKKAVESFQKKHFNEILAPLNNKTATGYVGEYTRRKLNQLVEQSVQLNSL